MRQGRGFVFSWLVLSVGTVLLCPSAHAQNAIPTLPTSAEIQEVTSTTASLPPPAPLPGGESKSTDLSADILSRPDFVRGIWVDAKGPALKSEAGIKELVENCRKAGFNTIYAQVRANGDALYKTDIAPMHQEVASGFDPLATLLKTARSGNKPIKVHAWLVALRVWTGKGSAPTNHVSQKSADWLTQTDDGSRDVGDYNDELWLDPGVVAVQDNLALIVTDLAKNYELDGIQIDRIRYPGTKPVPGVKNTQRTGYNKNAVERFNTEKKKSGTPAPADPEWTAWRRDQVTATVKKMRDAAKAVRKNAVFSVGAITFGIPPKSMEEYKAASDTFNYSLQDSISWAETGLLDTTVLMSFKDASKRPLDFEEWMQFTLANKGKAKVVIGVAGWLNQPDQALAMMLEPLFSPEADGVAVYGYHEPFKAAGNSPDFAAFRQVFDPSGLSGKLKEIAAVMAQVPPPGQAKLTQLSQFVGGVGKPSSGGAAALPTLTGDSGKAVVTLPDLPGAATPQTGRTGSLPSLPATVSSTAALPVLPGASAGASLPSLPGSSAASAASSLPDLPGSSASSSKLPSLPDSTKSEPTKTTADLPSLPGSSVASSSGSGSSSLPSLPDAAKTETAAASSGLPSLPSGDSSASSLPSLPGTDESASSGKSEKSDSPAPAVTAKTPALTAEQIAKLPDLPVGAATSWAATEEAAPPSLLAEVTPAVPIAVTEAVKTEKSGATAGPVPVSAEAIATPAPMAPVALGTPETVTIPDYGSMTNYTGKAVASAQTPFPTYVAPSVLTPQPVAPGQVPDMPLGREKPLAAPVVVRPDYSDPTSPYGTPVSAQQIRDYSGVQKHRSPVIAAPQAGVATLQIIVLRNGKEFSGRVLQRGAFWKIQLPNGSILTLPGDRIANVRATVQSLDVAIQ